MRKDIVTDQETFNEEYENLPANLIEQLNQFQDDKIGVIFHFGLYSLAGIVESWQLSKEDTWARKKPWRSDLAELRHDYWNLANDFHPNPDNVVSWAATIKDTGIKYGILTTKHHDGFSIFDTKFSNFHSNLDIFKIFSQTMQQHNLKVGAYYSKPDWHNENYWEPGSDPIGRYASYDPKENPAKWQQFNDFVKNQLLELTTNYGPIDILWLDGGWVNKDHHEFLEMESIVKQIRLHQPNILVVDRTIGGLYENYVTPERSIPETPPKKVWESNIPLAKNWGYVPNDQYKTFSEIESMIVEIVSKGGNVILGIGPKPDGTLPHEALKILAQLKIWLQKYGQAIFKTRAVDISNPPAGWFFTQRDNHLYAFVKQDSEKNWDYSQKILSVKALDKNVEVQINDSRVEINKNSSEDEFTVLEMIEETV